MHSVNACLTNNGGTLINLSSMNAVIGLEEQGLRVQAGCKMADIYDYLGKHVSRSWAWRARTRGGGGGGWVQQQAPG
jgi:FAD/FMN-containing dehydrogenase